MSGRRVEIVAERGRSDAQRAGGLGLDAPKTTPSVPVLSEVEGSLVRRACSPRRGGGTEETPDLN